MSIGVHLGNVFMSIRGDMPQDLRDEIRRVMSYVVPGHKYMRRYKQDQILAKYSGKQPWDGTKTVALIKPDGLRAPTGLLSYLRETLSSRGVPYEVFDERPMPITSPGYSTKGLILRDYQRSAVDIGLTRQRGVMKAATGSGKTEMMVAMFVEASSFPAVFYVPSCDLLEQAYDRFSEYVTKNGQPAQIGRVGAGHCDIQPITIATVQSCQLSLTGQYTKYAHDDCSYDDKTAFNEQQKKQIKEMVHQAQFAYFDEAQHVSADTIQDILNNSHSARYRIGGSASPWRDDGLDILIEAAFGRRFCDISATFLIAEGFLLRPNITFNHFEQKLGLASTFNAHYKKYVAENAPRNHWIAERAKFHVENGRPTIILVKWVSHAEILQSMIDGSEILTASGGSAKSPIKRKEVLERMRARAVMCVIGTSLLDEGVDVPAATAGIFAGGGKSSTRELQRVGRFIRRDPNDKAKDCAYIEEFHDHTKWLMHHAKARRKILETEPAFHVGDNRSTMSL
jgi:superfamily II DNA or RNA helicase